MDIAIGDHHIIDNGAETRATFLIPILNSFSHSRPAIEGVLPGIITFGNIFPPFVGP